MRRVLLSAAVYYREGWNMPCTLTDRYAELLSEKLETICKTQREKISCSAETVKKTLEKDGLIYVFGCGHSHMVSEETFYRAGGLACVCPVFYEPLMLHESASESSTLEKQEGLAAEIIKSVSFQPEDMLFCISTSGVNPVPVEFAAAAKRCGIPVIGISSDEYLTQIPHNSFGKHLQDVCDICIDNGAPHGDACLQMDGLPVRMTPVSTITSSFVINSILAEGTQMALKEGFEVPVYLSGNIPGGNDYNQKLIERYKQRIKCL